MTPAEEIRAAAYPPVHRWRVEVLDGDQWMPASGLHARDKARALLEAGNRSRPVWADGTPVRRRLIRETTTWTVEPQTPEA